MSEFILCGNRCGHNHESLNGPTGCCDEHGPYMYFCGECHDRATPTPRTPESADERGA